MLFHDQNMDIHSIRERLAFLDDLFSCSERKTSTARRVLRWLPPLSCTTASFLGLFSFLSYTSALRSIHTERNSVHGKRVEIWLHYGYNSLVTVKGSGGKGNAGIKSEPLSPSL